MIKSLELLLNLCIKRCKKEVQIYYYEKQKNPFGDKKCILTGILTYVPGVLTKKQKN